MHRHRGEGKRGHVGVQGGVGQGKRGQGTKEGAHGVVSGRLNVCRPGRERIHARCTDRVRQARGGSQHGHLGHLAQVQVRNKSGKFTDGEAGGCVGVFSQSQSIHQVRRHLLILNLNPRGELR